MTPALPRDNLPSMFKTMLQGISDLLYPHNCLLCHHYLTPRDFFLIGGHPERGHRPIEGSHAGDSSPSGLRMTQWLCPNCLNTIEFNHPPFCKKCSRHLADGNQSLCDDCLRKDLHFDYALGPCFYNETMRKLIHLFKYGNKTSLRHCFTEMILSFLENHPAYGHSFDLLVPIPLHPVRLRERGYNQSDILAQGIAQRLNLPLYNKNLIRTRHTQNQARVNPKNRFTNIHGAFRIKHSAQVKEKSVLLVDDLLTSGTTASEAARILKEAGARRVDVLTLALAP